MRQPQQNDKWINLSIEHEKEISDLQGKLADLKAENERLRKAGDAMADTRNKPTTLSEFGHLSMAWFAAKEGRDIK